MPYKDKNKQKEYNKKWYGLNWLDIRARRLHQMKGHYENKKEEYFKRAENMNAKYPTHKKARQAVQNAVYQGKLEKLPCEFCGEVKTQGHHFDYNKPLEIMWLCVKHHKQLHRIIQSLLEQVIEEIRDFSQIPPEVKVQSNPKAFMDWKVQSLKDKYL